MVYYRVRIILELLVMAFHGYGNIKALIVDDFNNFRMTVGKMLDEFGCKEVDSAVNGEVALKHCREKSYDLVLCDYNLGSGKNGQQVLEEMRHKKLLNKESLFLMVSAESSMTIVLSAYDYAPDAYLTKPITGKTLQKRLDRLLAQREEMLPVYQCLNTENTTDAIKMSQQAIKNSSRYSSSYQKLLGELLLKNGDLDAAEAVYKQVLEARPLDWAQVGMAKVKLGRGEFETAIKWLVKIISDFPYCMAAYDVLTEAYEKSGDTESMQKTLESAVQVSPMSILRQSSLGDSAAKNNDASVAARAYSRSVRLGKNSCHDDIKNHIQLGRVSVDLFAEGDSKADDLAKESLKVLDSLAKDFDLDKRVQVQSKMLKCQLYSKRGDKKQASDLFAELADAMDLLSAGLTIEAELDWVNTLITLDKKTDADSFLSDLVEKYKDDQVALERIDKMLSEPVSDVNRKKVAKLNKEGIGYYSAKDYKLSVDCFTRAKRLFPNHVGVHLNLVQALLAEMKEFGCNDEYMDVSLSALKKVESLIDARHDQFNRFLQLKDMIRVIERENG
jgi:DNA-binding response OmpR family regulator